MVKIGYFWGFCNVGILEILTFRTLGGVVGIWHLWFMMHSSGQNWLFFGIFLCPIVHILESLVTFGNFSFLCIILEIIDFLGHFGSFLEILQDLVFFWSFFLNLVNFQSFWPILSHF